MALTYNGTSPLSIVYNNTDLTVLKYGTTYVWAKAYTLSIDAGSNTTVTVNRTSSPNQHATTGNLSNGSLVYYGDVLTVSYTVSSGYAIATHTLNGTTFTSGTSHTVTGNVTVKTTAQASTSWHTVWSGYKSFYGTGTLSGITLVNSSYPTRVSGYGTETWHEGEQSQDHYFYNQSLPLEFVCGNNGITAFKLIVNGTSIYVSQFYSEDGGTPELSYGSGCVTKVEQYY